MSEPVAADRAAAAGRSAFRSLPRTLSTLDVAAMVVAITIGAGIYSTPQLIAQRLPSLPAILGCWIAAGVLAWLGGLVYAEAGTRLPATGGEYVYLVRAYGPWVGHLFGWVDFFLTAPSARVGLALVAADYATGGGAPGWRRAGIAATLIVALCAVNYLGARLSLGVQKALVAAKVGGLGLLIAACFLAPRAAPDPAASPAALGLEPVAAALLLVFFAYHGWARIGDVAGEIRDPRRSLPFGLLAGLALVAALYVGAVLGMHRILGMEGMQRSAAVAADAASRAVGPLGGLLAALLVVASTTSSMTASIMAASRIYFAMGRDGYLFRLFHRVHPRFGTPARAIVAHGAICLAFLALRQSVELHLTAFVFGRLLWRETLVDLAVLAGGLPLLALERWASSRRRAS
jgi:APA family basic amino acid/polyamine antiporter